jgi:hypothetical protein
MTYAPDAVELDITRLQPILSPWPPYFTDMNAARDRVQQVCYAKYFHYAYHPDAERGEFRLYIHFTAAKYAPRDGEFKVDRVGETQRLAGIKNEAKSDMAGKEMNVRPMLTDKVRAACSVKAHGTLVKEEKVDPFKVSTAAYGPAISKPLPYSCSSFCRFQGPSFGCCYQQACRRRRRG